MSGNRHEEAARRLKAAKLACLLLDQQGNAGSARDLAETLSGPEWALLAEQASERWPDEPTVHPPSELTVRLVVEALDHMTRQRDPWDRFVRSWT